jgi:hypothetical protein
VKLNFGRRNDPVLTILRRLSVAASSLYEAAALGVVELRLSWRSHLESKERHKNADGTHPNRVRNGL